MIALFDISQIFCSEFWLKNVEASSYNISSLPTGFKLQNKYSVKKLGIQPFIDSKKPNLSLNFRENMTPSVDEIVRLFQDKVDYESKNSGLLVYKRDIADHFYITISDTYCFNFGGHHFVVIPIPRNSKVVPKVKLLNRQQVLDRCLIAYELFQDWHYRLLGWNCEHFARLVTTGVAVSYQVQKSPLAFFNHNGYHPLAQEMMDQAVRTEVR